MSRTLSPGCILLPCTPLFRSGGGAPPLALGVVVPAPSRRLPERQDAVLPPAEPASSGDAAATSHAEAEAEAAPMLESRSEEHTSELQSPCNLVCRLLLEKKNL